jgi:protein SCO1/2
MTTTRIAGSVLGSMAVALLVLGCGSSDPSSTAGAELRGIVREVPLAVGDVSLPEVAADPATAPAPGGRLAMRAAPGGLLVVYFGFTSCPDVCPTTLADLRTAREQVGEMASDLPLAMVTVDPARDTPEKLAGYLDAFSDRWHALRTDDPAELEVVEDAFGASSAVTLGADGTPEVSHTAITYVVDERGQVVVEWTFGTPPDDMAHDLAILLAAASDGPADAVGS